MMRKTVEILAPVPRTLEPDTRLSVSIRIWAMGVRSGFSRPRLTTSTPLGPLRLKAAASGTGPRGFAGDTR
jgi:hypothetical protein